MSPATAQKPKQFAFTMTEEEHAMLHEVAAADGRSAANWVRHAIRTAHEQMKPKPKKRATKK